VYYVDANSVATGDGTSPELTGPHAAWKYTWQVLGLQPGDTVLFHRGDRWTYPLYVNDSGEPNNYITFAAYGTGEDPLIDVSGSDSNVPAIALYGVDYVELRNFRLIGSGGDVAFSMRWGNGKDGSGADGDGYTVTVRDVNVLSNIGSREGNHDGFSLHATYPDGSSQALFYNIAASKCRMADESGGSHQCFTAHEACKAKVYGARFSDSVNWYAGAQASQVEFYDLVADSSTSVGIIMTVSATEQSYCLVSDSNLVADAGGKLFGVTSGADGNGPRLIITDSLIKSSNSSPAVNKGNLTLIGNVIEVSDPNWRFDHMQGLLVLEGNRFLVGQTRDASGLIHTTEPARLEASGNFFDIAGSDFPVLTFSPGGETAQASTIRNNIFTNITVCDSIVHIDDDAIAPVIQNNVFYNPVVGGRCIVLEHDGDEPADMRLGFTNNIFYNVAEVIDAPAGAFFLAAYNCYFGGQVRTEFGSIEADPLFADALGGDFHLLSRAGRWDRELYRAGDLNADGICDLLDFAYFASAWQSSGPNLPADLNRDGQVDALDLAVFSAKYLGDGKAGGWVYDELTSPCIDAGNPGSPLGDELADANNVRLNIGAFGGTTEASMPPADWALLSDATNDGIVDFADFALGITAFPGLEHQPGDLNRDGAVDARDLECFSEDWLRQTSWYQGP